MLALDLRLGEILRSGREPIARQLRLAWWRDTLGKPASEWPRGEPSLDVLRAWRDPSALAALPIGWEALLAEELTPAAIAQFLDGRAEGFACLARELDGDPDDAAAAGRWWALADLAANLSNDAERRLAIQYAADLPRLPLLPRALRSLAVMARLGKAALARGGGPLLDGPRATLLALRTGLTGR